MICTECGKEFIAEADEPWGEERDICYECEREMIEEIAPELLGTYSPEETEL